jgi:creatinine amidohydrolase
MRLDPEIAPSGDFTDAADYRRKFPDGRIGSNPGLATIEAGSQIMEVAVAGLAEDYLHWMARATA